VAVVPSLYEGFSLPAIEAMACGVAVVATTGGALPEVVGTSGETGVLVPPNDPGALAAAIGTLLDAPADRARLGAAGRDRVMSRFTWQVTARGTAECYDALLAGARPPVVAPALSVAPAGADVAVAPAGTDVAVAPAGTDVAVAPAGADVAVAPAGADVAVAAHAPEVTEIPEVEVPASC
jgi:hypothetical protein